MVEGIKRQPFNLTVLGSYPSRQECLCSFCVYLAMMIAELKHSFVLMPYTPLRSGQKRLIEDDVLEATKKTAENKTYP